MLKDTALRKKMAELGLSTSGSRLMLERRHQEWVTLWNANCDSAKPKKRSELLHDLEIWERTVGSRAPTTSRAVNTGAQIKDKDFDGAAWAAKHGASFKDLIASARRTRNNGGQKALETNESEKASKEPILAQDEGEGSAGPPAQSSPQLPTATVVDLTCSPSRSREGLKHSHEGSIGIHEDPAAMLARDLPPDSISLSKKPEDLPPCIENADEQVPQ
jgi:E3 ubiquitin-protein ligase RAD18